MNEQIEDHKNICTTQPWLQQSVPVMNTALNANVWACNVSDHYALALQANQTE